MLGRSRAKTATVTLDTEYVRNRVEAIAKMPDPAVARARLLQLMLHLDDEAPALDHATALALARTRERLRV